MRSVMVGALLLGLSACGSGSDGGELAASNSEVSSAQVDAALGPADQSIQDTIAAEDTQNGIDGGNVTAAANSAGSDEEDEQ